MDPDDERHDGHPARDAGEPDDVSGGSAPGRGAVPNPYITAVGVVAAIIVIFAFSDVAFVVRLVVAFAIVAGAAYLSIVLARRR